MHQRCYSFLHSGTAFQCPTCLCFGSFEHMTRSLPFLRTTEHPSQSTFTDERTFIPRVCGDGCKQADTPPALLTRCTLCDTSLPLLGRSSAADELMDELVVNCLTEGRTRRPARRWSRSMAGVVWYAEMVMTECRFLFRYISLQSASNPTFNLAQKREVRSPPGKDAMIVHFQTTKEHSQHHCRL